MGLYAAATHYTYRGVWSVRSLAPVSTAKHTIGGGDNTTGWLQIVQCSSPAAGPWDFMASGALALNGTLCLGPGPGAPVGGCGGEMTLTRCTPNSPLWEVTSAPGFETVALKGLPGTMGPAALQGQVTVGNAVWLCNLTSDKAYCDGHHSCDFSFNATSGRLFHPENGLCLGAGPRPAAGRRPQRHHPHPLARARTRRPHSHLHRARGHSAR